MICFFGCSFITGINFIMEQGQFSTSHLHIPDMHYVLRGSKNLLNNTNVEDLDHFSLPN